MYVKISVIQYEQDADKSSLCSTWAYAASLESIIFKYLCYYSIVEFFHTAASIIPMQASLLCSIMFVS